MSAHQWEDGPDGQGYHCSCGISKCDDHACYDTCESWTARGKETRKEALWSKYFAKCEELDALIAELQQQKENARREVIARLRAMHRQQKGEE